MDEDKQWSMKGSQDSPGLVVHSWSALRVGSAEQLTALLRRAGKLEIHALITSSQKSLQGLTSKSSNTPLGDMVWARRQSGCSNSQRNSWASGWHSDVLRRQATTRLVRSTTAVTRGSGKNELIGCWSIT
ncbi:hypothetical protein E2C01_031622 [Portunus trituberculatus]|uniref:Uncharacterized protein n=1 Tax=Portunus trituberculatus TaxID=210409 RepID=A0A5B7ET90_PORTR|nr:hypothetical protein [Portunus trituberculatus]